MAASATFRPLLPDNSAVSVITPASDLGRTVLRHSTAHVMAQAVTRLWPGAKYAIGPAIEDGFYYDFELPGGAHFSPEDLARIEATMREIVAEDQSFVREEHSVAEGLEIFADQPYKLEIIERVEAAAHPGAGREEVEAETEAIEEGAGPSGVSTYRNIGSDGRAPVVWDLVDLCRAARAVHQKARLSSS